MPEQESAKYERLSEEDLEQLEFCRQWCKDHAEKKKQKQLWRAVRKDSVCSMIRGVFNLLKVFFYSLPIIAYVVLFIYEIQK